MKVAVHSMTGRPVRPGIRAALARAVKAAAPRTKGEINVILTDRPAIRRLNRRFLDHRGDTDVIAFPYESADVPGSPFGDIYISEPVARENAARFGDEPFRELIRLAVHGTLHLLGYRDHAPRDRARMWKKQEALVERLAPRAPQ